MPRVSSRGLGRLGLRFRRKNGRTGGIFQNADEFTIGDINFFQFFLGDTLLFQIISILVRMPTLHQMLICLLRLFEGYTFMNR